MAAVGGERRTQCWLEINSNLIQFNGFSSAALLVRDTLERLLRPREVLT